MRRLIATTAALAIIISGLGASTASAEPSAECYTIEGNVLSNGRSCTGEITIPAGVTSIDEFAFYGATELTSVIMGDDVTSIGRYAFAGDSRLTSITIPKNVTVIGEAAFACKISLTRIVVASENTNFEAFEDILYSKGRSTLISYPASRAGTSYSIPSSVTSISEFAFCQASALTRVVINSSVTSIGESAFTGARVLYTVRFLSSAAPTVGQYAFDNVPDTASAVINLGATGFLLDGDLKWNGLTVETALEGTLGSDGSLDTSFGSGGTVTTVIGSSNDFAYSTAIQSDGKIVAAGYSLNGSNSDFALARYNVDGSLDTSFGSGGKVTTAIGLYEDFAYSTAIQRDGKIVVAGYSYNGSNDDFALVRYNLNGSLDTSFGSGGKVTTAIGSSHDYANSVAIQSDGKIVVAGYSFNGSNDDFALARYNVDGSLDTSFGSGGKVTTAIGSSDEIYSVVIQSDGKIVASGNSWNGSNDDFALVRYNVDGSLDTSFGSGGKVTTAIGPANDYADSVVIQSDGKIVVAGASWNGENNDFALARYNVDGSLDTSFGIGGKVTTAIRSSDDSANFVVIQSDGKIVAAGYSSNGGKGVFALARYNVDGSLDTSFGTGGKVTTAIGSSEDDAYSVAIQSDGKIVAAGFSFNGSNYDFALARYNATSAAEDDSAAAEELAAAAREAAAKREAEKRSARIEIVERFKNAQKATVELFNRAEIFGITPGNIDQLHVEIFALPQTSRAEITQVLKVARKYEVLGIIASERVRTIYSNSLIEIGLISKESRYKETLTRVVKALPLSERSSYAGIKDAIEAELAAIQARKDRLTKILTLIASR